MAANPNLHPFFHSQTDVVAVLLGEGGQHFLLRLPRHIQTEDKFRLNSLEVFPLLHEAEAKGLQHLPELGILAGYIGVDLNDVAVILLRQGPRPLHQGGKGLPVL